MALLVTSESSDKTFQGWGVGSDLGEVTRPGIVCYVMPNSGERLCRECRNFDACSPWGEETAQPFFQEKGKQAPHKEGGVLKKGLERKNPVLAFPLCGPS